MMAKYSELLRGSISNTFDVTLLPYRKAAKTVVPTAMKQVTVIKNPNEIYSPIEMINTHLVSYGTCRRKRRDQFSVSLACPLELSSTSDGCRTGTQSFRRFAESFRCLGMLFKPTGFSSS